VKVAVFSDIHGNAVALEAVLADLETQRPDLIACGGDLAFGGPEPERAVGRVRALRIPCVRGNIHQAWIGRPNGGGLVVNTGSVGFPFDGDPRAAYAVLARASGGWTATTRRVSYDIERAAAAFPADHPDAATWARRLRTGTRG
jgi:predicted phosphodiesterase